MKPTFAVCAVLVGLLALSQSAIAEQKTARQCNDDWSANKASIQASGKTKRVFMAECRGVALTAPASVAAPAEKGQYASEAEAKASCPSDAVVWVNSISKIYHPSGSRSYGKTRSGAYMCEHSSVVTVPSRHRHCSSGRRWDADRRRHYVPAEVFMVAELATTKLTMKTLSLRQR